MVDFMPTPPPSPAQVQSVTKSQSTPELNGIIIHDLDGSQIQIGHYYDDNYSVTPDKKRKGGSLLRKLTKKVKRFVIDVAKEAYHETHPGRDSTLTAVYRQQKARNRILESYRRVKNALKDMQDRYVTSKDSRNFFRRYANLKSMIKDVTIHEKQYWTLINIPKPEGNEQQADYVNRVLNYLDERLQENPGDVKHAKTGISGLLGSTASLAEKAKDQNLMESLKNKSTDDLRRESERLQVDIYKLIKKYLGLRNLVSQLKVSYESSKGYPIIPRYSMLKDIIKMVIRAPAFSEICHEQEE